jgi:hypothetical protein
VRLHFPQAVADIVLTWAADTRENEARVTGTTGSIDIRGDTLILRADGREEHHRWPPALSDGSQHPDWFGPVVDEFIARVLGRAPGSRNLDEAAVCIAVEAAARESSRRGGAVLPLTAPAGAAG